MVKQILIIFIFSYIFLGEFISGITGLSIIKTILAILNVVVLIFYLLSNPKKINSIVLLPLLLIPVYLLAWKDFGYLNLIYTIIFGWVLAQDVEATLKLLKYLFIFQFLLVLYESVSGSYIYEYVKSGVVSKNEFDMSNLNKQFEDTGFRPKGLFSGTLVATSFIIYMSFIFRNSLVWLFFTLLLSILTNGRWAVLMVFITFLVHIFLNYNIVLYNRRLPWIAKISFVLIFAISTLSILAMFVPEVVLENFIEGFSFTSKANAGRIYAYAQASLVYLDYDLIGKLFGSVNNVVLDFWGREIASESGLISMFLDIGILGFLLYFYFSRLVWKRQNSFFIDLNNGSIGVKYFLLITWVSLIQYEHLNGNIRGSLFWFIIIAFLSRNNSIKLSV
jgi:hypothetical protein